MLHLPSGLLAAILAGKRCALRESGHSHENGYIQLCNICDNRHCPGRALSRGLPAARVVSRRHSHSSGP